MRINLLKLIVTLLFISQNSFSQDSLGSMRYKVVEESTRGSNQVPDIEENDTLFLCMYFDSSTKTRYDEFYENITNEGIEILHDSIPIEDNLQSIGVKLTLKQFQEIFKGEIKYKCVPASSFDGFLWRQKVESFIIPERYKGILKSITTTDPQTGGC